MNIYHTYFVFKFRLQYISIYLYRIYTPTRYVRLVHELVKSISNDAAERNRIQQYDVRHGKAQIMVTGTTVNEYTVIRCNVMILLL